MALPDGNRFPDVSRYRPVSDFDRFCRAYNVAAAKASEGATWHDPESDRFRRETLRRGTTPVLYHFLRAETAIAAQVDNFLAAVGDPKGIAVCLDVETSASGSNPTMAQADQWVDAVAERLRRPRSSILVYLPRWWWQAHGRRSKVLGDTILWNSHYSTSPYIGSYAGGRNEIIQYTSSGSIEGVTQPGDMNVAIGVTARDLRRKILAQSAPPKPATPQEDDDMAFTFSYPGKPVFGVSGGRAVGMKTPTDKKRFEAANGNVKDVRCSSIGQYNEYLKAFAYSDAGVLGRIEGLVRRIVNHLKA